MIKKIAQIGIKIEERMAGRQAPTLDEEGEPSQDSLNSTFDHEAHEVAFEDFGIDFEEGRILYRARIHEDRTRMEQLDLHEMGAPPPEKATADRLRGTPHPALPALRRDDRDG